MCIQLYLIDRDKVRAWIGLRKVNGVWTWDGRLKTAITFDMWDVDQPNLESSENCVLSEGIAARYRLHDYPCDQNINSSICERSSTST